MCRTIFWTSTPNCYSTFSYVQFPLNTHTMRRGSWRIRILVGLAICAFSRRCSSQEANPYTGRVQNIDMTTEQEIAIGLQSAPQMAQQHGGLFPSEQMQALVDRVGSRLVQSSVAKQTPYRYEFHLLA